MKSQSGPVARLSLRSSVARGQSNASAIATYQAFELLRLLRNSQLGRQTAQRQTDSDQPATVLCALVAPSGNFPGLLQRRNTWSSQHQVRTVNEPSGSPTRPFALWPESTSALRVRTHRRPTSLPSVFRARRMLAGGTRVRPRPFGPNAAQPFGRRRPDTIRSNFAAPKLLHWIGVAARRAQQGGPVTASGAPRMSVEHS